MPHDTSLHTAATRGIRQPWRALLAGVASAWLLSLPAQAAPLTLHIDGLFTATNSSATRNSTAANALAASVNGSNSWNQLSNIALSLELDFDDQLTRTTPSAGTWVWSYDSVQAVRIQLGNAHFATEAAAGTSLGSIRVGATSTDSAPALNDGLLLDLTQPSPFSGSPRVYSFPEATPQVSGGGLYEHYFRTAFDQHTGNRVLDFWGVLASTDALNGGLPTGRWSLTDFEVTTWVDTPANHVPEPAGWTLCAVALLAWRRARRR